MGTWGSVSRSEKRVRRDLDRYVVLWGQTVFSDLSKIETHDDTAYRQLVYEIFNTT
jgi:hypothetical protein